MKLYLSAKFPKAIDPTKLPISYMLVEIAFKWYLSQTRSNYKKYYFIKSI